MIQEIRVVNSRSLRDCEAEALLYLYPRCLRHRERDLLALDEVPHAA